MIIAAHHRRHLIEACVVVTLQPPEPSSEFDMVLQPSTASALESRDILACCVAMM